MYIIVLLLMSLGMGADEIIMNAKGEVVSDLTQALWAFMFFILSTMWSAQDSKLRNISRPFDFGFLIYILWPISFPTYLVATRGMEGIVMFLGFLVIWCGPWLLGLVSYVYIYSG
ncbi:hypothetical protein GCM10011352_34940 [Marinobacterium zhoushanense]|uniref:Uncharacterized protein n=1 Tax=Marinobacterium zhoushanense TaxID=1679163 RepID=A0ABQ1KT31_9GAMM|nr:hypothetical protein GCM10011352_34940 [Marinobacterium zhoushanense]